jgi:formylglycine-generating enzyme required for sulfatase activity
VLPVNRTTPTSWPANAPPSAKIPFDRDQAFAHQQAWANYLGVPVEFINSLGMKLRLIPPGEFVMGSPPADVAEALEIGIDDLFYRDCVQSEGPQHHVQLSKPWFLGVYEVTQEQYELVNGENPAYFSPHRGGQYEVTDLETHNFPVELVSWNQSAQFCNALSRREGLTEKYAWKGEACTVRPGSGYHLPTEAQWEFACRAGTDTRYWFAATGEQLSTYGWYKVSAVGRTHSVGQLQPNPFGLHDLLGNVSEWCQDGWQRAYYSQFERQTGVDPNGPSSDFFFRVLRGGSYRHHVLGSRSAKRVAGGPNLMLNDIGLRVAISVDGVKVLHQTQREQAPAGPEQPPGPVLRGEPP